MQHPTPVVSSCCVGKEDEAFFPLDASSELPEEALPRPAQSVPQHSRIAPEHSPRVGLDQAQAVAKGNDSCVRRGSRRT